MKKILMTGGGSAGHVIPNLALLPKLKEHYVVSYAGTHAIEYSLLRIKGSRFILFRHPNSSAAAFAKILHFPAAFSRASGRQSRS